MNTFISQCYTTIWLVYEYERRIISWAHFFPGGVIAWDHSIGILCNRRARSLHMFKLSIGSKLHLFNTFQYFKLSSCQAFNLCKFEHLTNCRCLTFDSLTVWKVEGFNTAYLHRLEVWRLTYWQFESSNNMKVGPGTSISSFEVFKPSNLSNLQTDKLWELSNFQTSNN